MEDLVLFNLILDKLEGLQFVLKTRIYTHVELYVDIKRIDKRLYIDRSDFDRSVRIAQYYINRYLPDSYTRDNFVRYSVTHTEDGIYLVTKDCPDCSEERTTITEKELKIKIKQLTDE